MVTIQSPIVADGLSLFQFEKRISQFIVPLNAGGEHGKEAARKAAFCCFDYVDMQVWLCLKIQFGTCLTRCVKAQQCIIVAIKDRKDWRVGYCHLLTCFWAV